jgi:ATP-dependent protease ClpP protease subunit
MTNQNRSLPAKFRASASGDTLTLTCYDVIGADWDGSGITAENFKTAIDANPSANLALRINSPGGDAFEGIAIFNLLKSYNKPISVYVDGLAASAASIVAMAASPGKLTMGAGSMAMIHNATTFTYGSADDLRRDAGVLDQLSDSIAGIYVARTELSKSSVATYMDGETWFTADEFVTAGFADGLVDDDEDDEDGDQIQNVSKTFNKVLKSYKNLPEAFKHPAKVKRAAKVTTKATAEVIQEPVAKPEPNNLTLYAAKAKLRRTK